ncbi:response regulator transcription factor [Clostridium drakei]|uniref:Stage 0 sporulation protein A homolog n=1 Tax=Clostridium drakei TaxID=332101 RepID=A0A2U8DV18_9CLOT|nr:response regulator transcription factor [Clostridium drakei]AWI06104.1 DNA-binding response regulator [Clostridium drakei]
MFKNLLIVEDDAGIRNLIAMYFRKENFNIYEAEDGNQALDIFKLNKIDLIILDIMIPYINGFKVCECIRRISNVPIIMLTAKTEEQDILQGFDEGTDAYVTKPFSPKVLVAKANALLNRVDNKINVNNNIFSKDGFIIDFNSGEVTVDNSKIVMTHKEYDLLKFLIKNKGIILSKDIILDKVWGYDYFGDPRTIDTHIRRLRQKLGDNHKFIVTVKGRGYKFDAL